MATHLEKVYTALLHFFQSAARVFSSGQGKIRKTPAVICDLMWTPFDTRFKDLLEQMESHRNMIRYEIEILQAQILSAVETSASLERTYAAEERKLAAEGRIRAQKAAEMTYDMRALLEKQQQDSIFARVHTWLRPSDFNEVLEASQEIREEGTCEWILKNLEFNNWKSLEWSLKTPSNSRYLSSNFVWFQGNPGYGKTVLASHVIEILRDELCAPNFNVEILYYFFSSNRANAISPASAWRAILSQILSKHRTDSYLMEKFAFAKEENYGQPSASPVELTSLLQCCLSGMQHVYLILDGVDECDDTAALTQLLVWVGTNTSVKVLLFSRPNVGKLQRIIPKTQCITVDRGRTSADIERFLQNQLQVLVDEELISATADLSDLVKRLVIGADGMFLWARLMINYLESPAHTPKTRLGVVLDVILPEGLENMYDRILQLIYRGNRVEQDLARRVFLWLAYALRPLNIQGFQAVLTPEDDMSPENDVLDEARASSLKSLKETVVTICGGLVEIVKQDPTWAPSGSFQFIHLSVKEHLLRLSSSAKVDEAFPSILPSYETAQFELASRCIEEVGSSKNLMHGECLKQQQDLTRYAETYWTDHLVHAVPTQVHNPLVNSAIQEGAISKLVSSLTHFLDNPKAIRRWIYSCYSGHKFSFGITDLGSRNIEIWVAKISSLGSRKGDLDPLKQLSNLMSELVRDLRLIISSWGSKLSLDPDLIWDEVPAFLKSQFLVSDGTKTYSLASSKPQLARSSKNPLSMISRTTWDGLLNGALSVWPVEEFEKDWQSLGADYRHSTYQLCDGWVAKYEIWTLNQEMRRLVDTTLPLRSEEVNLLLRQSFRGDGEG